MEQTESAERKNKKSGNQPRYSITSFYTHFMIPVELLVEIHCFRIVRITKYWVYMIYVYIVYDLLYYWDPSTSCLAQKKSTRMKLCETLWNIHPKHFNDVNSSTKPSFTPSFNPQSSLLANSQTHLSTLGLMNKLFQQPPLHPSTFCTTGCSTCSVPNAQISRDISTASHLVQT